jgi:hypothetical protein
VRRLLATIVAIPLLAAFAAPARAADVVIGGDTELWFDDNVYGSTSGEVSDFSFDVGPSIDVSERWGSVEGSLDFTPTYELYFDESELRGFNYDASGSLSWSPAPTTTLSVTDTFARYRNLRGLQTSVGSTPPVLAGREPYTRNIVQLVATHRTSPKGQILARASYGLWDFSRSPRPGQVDYERPRQDTYSGDVQGSYLITPRTRVGALVAFTRQAFDYQVGFQTHTDYYNASFTLNFVPAETFLFRASVGPALVRQPAPQQGANAGLIRLDLIRTDGSGSFLVGVQGSCPLLPNGDPFDGPGCQFVAFPFPNFLRLLDPIPVSGALQAPDRNNWTYFADFALEKDWERGSADFSYRRDQGTDSAVGYSTIADTVELRGSYSVRRNLSFNASAVWEDREQTRESALSGLITVLGTLPATPTLPAVNNLVPVGAIATGSSGSRNNETIRTFRSNIGGVYTLNERMRFRATVGWIDQNASPRSGYSDAQRLYVVLGFDLELEPFRW